MLEFSFIGGELHRLFGTVAVKHFFKRFFLLFILKMEPVRLKNNDNTEDDQDDHHDSYSISLGVLVLYWEQAEYQLLW